MKGMFRCVSMFLWCLVSKGASEEESIFCFAVEPKKKEEEQNMREKKKQNERLATGVNLLSHQTLFLIP